jgi:hypothetical protein
MKILFEMGEAQFIVDVYAPDNRLPQTYKLSLPKRLTIYDKLPSGGFPAKVIQIEFELDRKENVYKYYDYQIS